MNNKVLCTVLSVFVLAIVVCSVQESFAQTKDFPNKEVTIVVQYAPGGNWDAIARVLAPALKKNLPKPVNIIVDNKEGAGGRVGNSFVYRSRPDGYTMGLVSVPGALVTAMFSKDSTIDFSKVGWIGTLTQVPVVMFVKGNSPINSFDDLAKLSEKRPVKECSTGLGDTIDSITVATLSKLNVNYKTVSGYKGALDAALGVMRGDGDFAVLPGSGFVIKYVQTKELKPILSMSFERDPLYPNVQSVKELKVQGTSDLQKVQYYRCLFVPPGTPKEIVKILSDAVGKSLKDPGVIKWAKEAGEEITPFDEKATEEAISRNVKVFKDLEKVISKHLNP
jgi:tripartite-type tricarboxylate transporter receptor subunit TctC